MGSVAQMGRGDEAMPSFDDGFEISRLVIRYALTGLVTLILVSVVTAFVSRRLGTQEAIEDARRVASITATAAVEPVLQDSIAELDADAIVAVDDAVRFQVLERVPSLLRVKIWSRDGTIVYSDEGRLIGDRFELDEGALEVLDGPPNGSSAEVSDLSEPENRYEEPALKLLEVYMPVTTPSGERFLYEAYFRYDGVVEAGRRAWLRFAPVTLGSLLFLEVLQVPLVMSLARRLRRTQEQREHLLQQAIEATDAERRRIASDLHDGVVQDLAGVTFALAATARRVDGEAATQVAQAGDQVRDAVRSLRSLLVEIYPPNLYSEGLEAALGDLLAKVEPRGIEATMAVDVPDDLGLDATQLIYRTAQEGLRNVVAHADARRVDLSVSTRPDKVVLRVIDDGCGLDPDNIPHKAGHLGLRALAGLASSKGSAIIIESAPGQGTELRLEVPRS
jgi:two-component system, NarL family, sensor kinase